MRRTSQLSVIIACLTLETRWKQGKRSNSLPGTPLCYKNATQRQLLLVFSACLSKCGTSPLWESWGRQRLWLKCHRYSLFWSKYRFSWKNVSSFAICLLGQFPENKWLLFNNFLPVSCFNGKWIQEVPYAIIPKVTFQYCFQQYFIYWRRILTTV